MIVDVQDEQSKVQFDNESFDSFFAQHASQVTFNGQRLEFGVDPYAHESGDNAIVSDFGSGIEIAFAAVPEPSSFAMFMVTAVVIGRRRRR